MQPQRPYQPAPPPQPHEYEFIVNPGQPKRRSLNLLPSGAPPALRIVMIVGGLFALLIVFLIAKAIFSGGGNTEALTSVAQQQQQIIHLTTDAASQNNLSSSNLNFSVTAKATLSSAQQQLVTYLQNNGHKVKAKTLGLKISANLDEQLQTAATSSTYNDTYRQTMQTELSDYQQALREAYKQTSGPKGRKLLNDQFKGSELLLQQLNEPTT